MATKEKEIEINEESIEVLIKKKEHLKQRLNTFNFKTGGWIISVIAGIIFTSSYTWVVFSKSADMDLSTQLVRQIPYALLGAVVGPFMYGYFIGLSRMSASRKLREIELKLIKLGAEELQENIEMNFFTKLVQINFKYLDQYYLQTQEQADKSFRLASSASIVGLIIIVVGIIMMFFDKTEPAYVTTSAGVISEFIAAVFFYLYNRTILKMSQYHQKLVITQNISLALKISEDMEGDSKVEIQKMIVDRLTTDTNKYLSIKE